MAHQVETKAQQPKRLSPQEKRFQEKFTSLELFVRVIAHDLNGPLTGMNLTLQQARKLVKNPLALKSLDTLEHDLNLATNLLEELKSLNRRETFRPTLLDIGTEVQLIVEQIHNLSASPLTVAFTQCREKLLVAGDISRLRRAWQNIIRNAVEMALDKKNEEPVLFQVNVKKSGRFARISFHDNAGGITRQRLPRLFEPFYTTKGSKNRGLGLFIARKIVLEHHGKIRIVSARPSTWVTIDLPLVK